MKKLLSVEEIKEGCGFADGFEYVEGGNTVCRIRTPELGLIISTCSVWNFVYHPLFLQRVIEGINKEFLQTKKRGYNVLFGTTNILVDYGCNVNRRFLYEDYESIDQAKEQAIKYILGELRK